MVFLLAQNLVHKALEARAQCALTYRTWYEVESIIEATGIHQLQSDVCYPCLPYQFLPKKPTVRKRHQWLYCFATDQRTNEPRAKPEPVSLSKNVASCTFTLKPDN